MEKVRKAAIVLLATVLGSPWAVATGASAENGFPEGLAHRAGEINLTTIRLLEAERDFPGVTSSGVAVAVIDDGIDRDHEYFTRPDGTSRVVAEACFLERCPNGRDAQVGIGAATPALTLSGLPNSHGTLVAGTAAGRLNRNPEAYEPSRGVASTADIVAIRVFPDDEDERGARWSDIRRALEWVLDNAARYRIVAVNMSFGAGSYGADCGGVYPAFADLMARLNAVGVTPVAATGNEGRPDAVMVPACLPGVVGVGSLDESGNALAPSSNSGPGTDLLAPGRGILSAMPGRGAAGQYLYASASGTSFAAPHVAGALALLRASRPASTASSALDALVTGARRGLDGNTGLGALFLPGAFTALAGSVPPISGPLKEFERIAGADRYQTSALASQQAYPNGNDVAYIVSGANFPDALVAGGLASTNPGPILLTANTLSSDVRSELQRLNPREILIVGGAGVVSDNVFSELTAVLPTAAISRIAGADRYQTSAMVAYGTDVPAGTSTVYLVSGANFPDAVVAAGLASTNPGPILLTANTLSSDARDYLRQLPDCVIVVLGGEAVVSAAAIDEARR